MVATPVDPTPTLLGPSVLSQSGPQSPEAVKMMREYAKALMARQERKNPYYPWSMGLNDMAGDWLGALMMRRANEAERSRYEGALPDTATPAATTSSAVPGGTASAAPFSDRPPTEEPRLAGLPPSGTGDSRPDQGSSTPSAETSTRQQVAALDPAAAGISDEADRLGKEAIDLSSRAETSKTGQKALFNISPDTKGSKSYGPFGLNSRSGSVADFVKDNPQFGLTAQPGSPEFDAQWRKAAAVQADEFQKAHDTWHQKNIMGGLTDSMTKAGIDPRIANDPRVQKYMADRKVQMNTVGLKQALNAAQGARTPEDFIHAVSAADKDRLPVNFRSYLADHPNNVRGLNNRIDLRHNAALAAADPELTGKMVAAYRGDTAADAPPPEKPVKVAEEGITSIPQGDLSEQWKSAYRKMIMSGWPPDAAAEQADRVSKAMVGSKGMEVGLMPRVQLDDFGQAWIYEQGKAPRLAAPGTIPGWPGKISPLEGIPGGFVQQRLGPDGILRPMIITPTMAPRPSVAPTSPAPSAVGGISPAPVTAPPAATGGATPAPTVVPPAATSPTHVVPPPAGGGGLMTAAPPAVPGAVARDITGMGAKPGARMALADTAGVMRPEEAVRTKVAEETSSDPDKYAVPKYDLDKPKTSLEKSANEELEWADEHRVAPPDMGNIRAEGLRKAQEATDPFEALDALGNIAPSLKVREKTLEDQIINQNKAFAELQKQYRDTREQGVKLAPELKAARAILDSPDFHAGPASKLVENIRGLRGEAESLFRTWANDARAKNAEDVKSGRIPESNPAVWDRAADWIKNEHDATANQVYTKILSGSILQSLRGMLGPNAGQFRVQELKMLEQAFGNPNITLDANKLVMAMVDKLNDRHILLGQMADTYLRKNKVLDPSFEEAVTRFEQKNPVFTNKELLELGHIGITGRGSKEPEPTPAAPAPVAPDVAPRGMPELDEIRRERERRRTK